MDSTRIIVVEDNIVYCEYVCNLLARDGYRTVQAYRLSTAKQHLKQATDDDIVVSDLRLPDGNGIELLRWMRKEGMMQPFFIMTDYAEVPTAVESMKFGSIDYIPKQLLENKLVPQIRTIEKERQAGFIRMPVFPRESSAFQKIMHRIKIVAGTDMSVMIFGENGTGKEHIAHHLHNKSKRAGKPFVAVDCGSLTKELAPSAFFGHIKGSFTGADCARKGLAEFFREVANKELECNVSGFSIEARKALLTHAWPGNVRELRQKIMGAVLQAQEGMVAKEHLELTGTKPTSPVSFALHNDMEEKERILRALKQANGNRSIAADCLE